MINLKVKPVHDDFKNIPVINFTGQLDKPVRYDNTFQEITESMRNPEFVKNMGNSAVCEVFDRAYNYTSKIFAGYNRRAYISLKYADAVRQRFVDYVDYH